MRSIFLIIFLLLSFGLTTTAKAQEMKTVVEDNVAKTKLLGKHFVSLQWIGQDNLGTATVVERKGVVQIKGKQKSRQQADLMIIDGVISKIEKKQFTFDGSIVTKISYINDGKECVRRGEMVFKITGKRKYWRLQQMLNPCTNVETDYVDIYFR